MSITLLEPLSRAGHVEQPDVLSTRIMVEAGDVLQLDLEADPDFAPEDVIELRVHFAAESVPTAEALRLRQALGSVLSEVGRVHTSVLEERLRSLVNALMEFPGAKSSPMVHRLLTDIAYAAQETGVPRLALELWPQVLAHRLEMSSPDSLGVLNARLEFANLVADLESPGAAIQLLELVHDTALRRFPSRPWLDEVRVNLSRALTDAGRAEDVLDLTSLALPGMIARRGADHQLVLLARRNLAVAHDFLGNPDIAELLFVESESALLAAGRIRHLELASIRKERARYARLRRDYAQAQELLDQALDALPEDTPSHHPIVLRIRVELGRTLRQRGQTHDAYQVLQEIYDQQRRHHNADIEMLDEVRLSLATACWDLGLWKECHDLETAVLESRRARYPPRHPMILDVTRNLAITMRAFGDVHGALALQREVLDDYEQRSGLEARDTLRAKLSLATSLYLLGEMRASLDMMEDVLEVAQRTLQPDDEDLQRIRLGTASVLNALGRRFEAQALAKEAVSRMETTLPPEHRGRIDGILILSRILRDLNDASSARILLEGVVEILSRTARPEDSTLQSARFALSSALLDHGEHEAALALNKSALDELRRTMPEAHQRIALYKMGLTTPLVVNPASGALGCSGARGWGLTGAIRRDHVAPRGGRLCVAQAVWC